jgi:hypothetical protein
VIATELKQRKTTPPPDTSVCLFHCFRMLKLVSFASLVLGTAAFTPDLSLRCTGTSSQRTGSAISMSSTGMDRRGASAAIFGAALGISLRPAVAAENAAPAADAAPAVCVQSISHHPLCASQTHTPRLHAMQPMRLATHGGPHALQYSFTAECGFLRSCATTFWAVKSRGSLSPLRER